MYVLDTDHISLLERVDSVDKQHLLNRLGRLPEGDVATSIIAFEEQNNYCSIVVLDFDQRSAAEFQQLKTQRVRIGTMDLKMASIVLANDAILLSRNLRDFRRVPNLRVEDWIS